MNFTPEMLKRIFADQIGETGNANTQSKGVTK